MKEKSNSNQIEEYFKVKNQETEERRQLDPLVQQFNSLQTLTNREEQAKQISNEIIGSSQPRDREIKTLFEELIKITLDSIDIDQQIKETRRKLTPEFTKSLNQEITKLQNDIKTTKESISKTERSIKLDEFKLYQRFNSPKWLELLDQLSEQQTSYHYSDQLISNTKNISHKSHSDLKQKNSKPISPLKESQKIQQHSPRGIHNVKHSTESKPKPINSSPKSTSSSPKPINSSPKPIITSEMKAEAAKRNINLSKIEILGSRYVSLVKEVSNLTNKRILAQTHRKVFLGTMLDDLQRLDILAKRNNEPGIDMALLRHENLPEGGFSQISRPGSSSSTTRRKDDDTQRSQSDLNVHSARPRYRLLSPISGVIRK